MSLLWGLVEGYASANGGSMLMRASGARNSLGASECHANYRMATHDHFVMIG
jgi:hypothetical protein